MIELREVGVTVPGAAPGVPPRVLLTDVTLTLSERRIAVIGANGSGKSTLLRLLNGLVLPTRGTVRVNGLDTAAEGSAVRRAVGFVFTDPLAQLVMPTPVEDVELSLRRTVPRPARRARASELLSAYGLGALQHSSVYDLSGGERQLVALVSVLAVEPSIVVADEPTTLLDLRNRNRIRDELSRLDQQLVVATHDLELAQDADRVLVVEGGRVVADGPPDVAIAAYVELVS
ncbi:MAG TPA: ABC transporter ATP-binding protein [Propionibacteriaceae bacterium]|nr:ABC transporter ATP-binding protein [Propionibacteriaceae bacterium]